MMRFRRVTRTDMKLATAPKMKAGAIDCAITCESCGGGGVSSIRFPHASRAPVLFRAIQRIRIAHNEDRFSGPQRRPLTALRLGKSAAEAPETRAKLAPAASNNGERIHRVAARTRSPAEDQWIHLKSMITPSAPS